MRPCEGRFGRIGNERPRRNRKTFRLSPISPDFRGTKCRQYQVAKAHAKTKLTWFGRRCFSSLWVGYCSQLFRYLFLHTHVARFYKLSRVSSVGTRYRRLVAKKLRTDTHFSLSDLAP